MSAAQVRPAKARTTAQITLPDGRIFEAPVGTPLGEYLDAAYPDAKAPIAAALVNRSLEELSYAIGRDSEVVPIDITTSDGMRIYHRSVTFLLVVAMRELYPEARVQVDYSVTLGGFYCEVQGREPLTPAELEALERRMHEIVAADEVITKTYMSVRDAQRMFAEQGYLDKVKLLDYAEEPQLPVYELRGVRDYFYGYMLPSTGKIICFGVQHVPPGFVLRLPRRYDPTRLTRHRDYPKLTRVFREYGRWLRILDVGDIASLNAVADTDELRKVILVAEALHEKHISGIAEEILRRSERVRLVLIAGPSSSGKTTFARRLAIQLMAVGLHPFAIGLDDYFLDRERTPRDDEGNYDFEALEAIDLELFNTQLADLIAGREVRLPRYDFRKGTGRLGEPIRPPEDAIIIVEGIHGMNPDLVRDLPEESIYRIYVSALTQLNVDHHNRVPTTDTRLLRRLVRDAQFRGYTAQQTIKRWESVRRGEERYIFPYQENADAMFNSALVYELGVLKPLAEPLLLRVPWGTMEYIEARRLLAFLRWVRPCTADYVPRNSILREFISGSILRDCGL